MSGEFHASSPSFDRAQSRLLEMLQLRPGWDYGRGDAPGVDVVQRGLTVLHVMRSAGFERLEAFSRTDGGVDVNAYRSDEDIIVTARADGWMSLLHEIGDEEKIEISHDLDENIHARLMDIGAHAVYQTYQPKALQLRA